MKDNFSMNEWRLKVAIQEIEKTNEDEIGLSDILARDLYKLQGKISDDLFYKLRKAINSQDPTALAKAKEIISRINPEKDDYINMSEEKGQCPECGCKMEAAICNECGYMEEATFTGKHDDNPELKGGQKDLPDELQAKIVAKEGKDKSKVNILGIDFNITEMNGRIFFSFIDKKAASIKIREIGSNEIVNKIQKSLDNAYGKGEFFFKSGDHAEFQNGYLFQRNLDNVDLNKLKFESLHGDHEVSMAQNSLKAIISSASQLMSKLGDNERNIPGWIQDHIAKSENYIEQANQSFHELEPYDNSGEVNEAMFTSANSNNPEGDTLVLRFLQGIAKKFDYPVAQAALFVKDRIKKLGY